MKRKIAGSIPLGVSIVWLGSTVAAQPLDSNMPASPDDCVATEDGTLPSEEEILPPEEDLSEALEPCDGVLRPPPVGDGELTITPPEGGVTPVIPPRQLPD
jgi:hypothetical protein